MREVDFTSLVDGYVASFVSQMERVRELNAGPTGEDIVNTQFGYLTNAAIGASLITSTMQAIVSTKSSINVPYAVNPTTQWVEGWLRSNCAKATLPMAEVEATVCWLAGGYRPVCLTASGARAHVVTTVVADPLVNNNATAQNYFNTILSRADTILGGPVLVAPRNPALCVAAYSRFVAFKKQMFGLTPMAVPTSGECLPYMLAFYEPNGNSVRVFGNFSLDALFAKELAVGYLLQNFNTLLNFPIPDPNRQNINAILAAAATALIHPFWLKAVMIKPFWEADGCDFIGKITAWDREKQQK